MSMPVYYTSINEFDTDLIQTFRGTGPGKSIFNATNKSIPVMQHPLYDVCENQYGRHKVYLLYEDVNDQNGITPGVLVVGQVIKVIGRKTCREFLHQFGPQISNLFIDYRLIRQVDYNSLHTLIGQQCNHGSLVQIEFHCPEVFPTNVGFGPFDQIKDVYISDPRLDTGFAEVTLRLDLLARSFPHMNMLFHHNLHPNQKIVPAPINSMNTLGITYREPMTDTDMTKIIELLKQNRLIIRTGHEHETFDFKLLRTIEAEMSELEELVLASFECNSKTSVKFFYKQAWWLRRFQFVFYSPGFIGDDSDDYDEYEAPIIDEVFERHISDLKIPPHKIEIDVDSSFSVLCSPGAHAKITNYNPINGLVVTLTKNWNEY